MDCKDIPGRVFLDTSSLNFILDYGEYIFDGMTLSETSNKYTTEDINAFYNIFLTGKRATWQIAISPFTYKEVIDTQDAKKRYYLEGWFMNVWDYWRNIIEDSGNLPSFIEAEHTRIKLLSSGMLDMLPDIEDRVLISDAIVYRCDCFCTRDWQTILKHRDHLTSLPIKIITPTEWWNLVRSFAALWV